MDGEEEQRMIEELERRRRPGWSEPFHWWGPFRAAPERRSLADLVADGVLAPDAAPFLVEEVRTGGSVVVAAEPSGVGKSTVAAALAAELPPSRTAVYLRGSYETFDFLPEAPAAASALLINELSPHLPIYTWGETARRTLQLGATGYQILATAHAARPEQLVYQLARPALSASPGEIAALGLCLFLAPRRSGPRGPWYVARAVRLATTGAGAVTAETAAEWPESELGLTD